MNQPRSLTAELEVLYDRALAAMERTVHILALRVPAPQPVPYMDSFVFRYIERSVHQALVQKLARLVSTLRAARLLMHHGYVQEQAVLQRVLDELEEDVTFLSYGVIRGENTDLLRAYLDAFYEEEFDADSALESTQKRPMPPRKKIQAYIAGVDGGLLDPSTAIEVSRTIHKTYSGYVHGASPHIMDMYGGNPARFHMSGMLGTPRHEDHRDDLWNYFYRGAMAFGFAAKAFGDDELFHRIHQFVGEFERQSEEIRRSHAAGAVAG